MRGVKSKAERTKAKRAIRAMAEIARAKVDALEEKVRMLSAEVVRLRSENESLRREIAVNAPGQV